MTVEEFYEKQNYPKYDKHDRRVGKFTYYDMCDFAEAYAAALAHNGRLYEK